MIIFYADLCTSRASMHDEEGWLVQTGLSLLLDVLLVFPEQVGGQDHVARLVHTVHVTEGCSYREHRTDRTQAFVNIVNLEKQEIMKL